MCSGSVPKSMVLVTLFDFGNTLNTCGSAGIGIGGGVLASSSCCPSTVDWSRKAVIDRMIVKAMNSIIVK